MEEALKKGLEAKSKEFVEKGAEVYAKVQTWTSFKHELDQVTVLPKALVWVRVLRHTRKSRPRARTVYGLCPAGAEAVS
jgi:hypothetical protein